MGIIIDESSKAGYVVYRDDEYEYHLGNFDLQPTYSIITMVKHFCYLLLCTITITSCSRTVKLKQE